MQFTTEGVGTKAGVYIWRIENLKPVDVMPAQYGKVRGPCFPTSS